MFVCFICIVDKGLDSEGYTKLIESTSPNNENVIIIKNKSAFLFGSTPVKITSKKQGINWAEPSDYETAISNDGATLYDGNVIIEWVNDSKAIVTLRGDEQLDNVIEINFGDNISYKMIQDKY